MNYKSLYWKNIVITNSTSERLTSAQIMAANNTTSNKMLKSSKKNSRSPRITNSSNDVSWQLGDLLLSDNSSNISSNSRRNSSENLHRKILEQNHQLQNEPSSLAQTWHSGQHFPSSSQSSISSRDLNSSKNSSGSRGNSNENLHRQLLKRNHHLQNEP